MIKHLLKIEVAGLKTLDMGCGTGILAILAALKGAKPVDAIDIDPWCYENTIENVSRNRVDFIKAYEGDSSLLKGKQYDLIIANINRNILIDDIPTYAGCLNHEGVLLLSGLMMPGTERHFRFYNNIKLHLWLRVKRSSY